MVTPASSRTLPARLPICNIRAVVDSDVLALSRIFLASRRQAFQASNPETFSLSDFESQTEGELVFLAENECGTPLGFISIWEADSFVHHLFVDPQHQRKGVGERLLQSLESWLPRPYRLKCLAANQSALAFYRQMGWKEIGRGDDDLGEFLLMEF